MNLQMNLALGSRISGDEIVVIIGPFYSTPTGLYIIATDGRYKIKE